MLKLFPWRTNHNFNLVLASHFHSNQRAGKLVSAASFNRVVKLNTGQKRAENDKDATLVEQTFFFLIKSKYSPRTECICSPPERQ